MLDDPSPSFNRHIIKDERITMEPWIVSLSHFLHISATVVWVGGIFMTILVILPGSKTALESPLVGKLMKEVGQRFTPMANMSILLLIVSGLILFYYANRNFTSFGDLLKSWNTLIFCKFGVVVIMVCVHFYRGSILSKRIIESAAQANEAHTAGLRKLSLDLVKTNLILGFVVLVFTAVLIS